MGLTGITYYYILSFEAERGYPYISASDYSLISVIGLGFN